MKLSQKINEERIVDLYLSARHEETKKILIELFSDIDFENQKCKSWEELEKRCNLQQDWLYRIIPDKYKALRKLELLRDHYDGYHYTQSRKGYCIKQPNSSRAVEFLCFKTIEEKEKFQKYFEQLINEAAELL